MRTKNSKNTSFRPLLSGLILLVYLSNGLVSSENLVLCVGRDGHVEIEATSYEGHCGPDRGRGTNAPLSILGNRSIYSHCGPCVDIALAALDTLPFSTLSKDQTPQTQSPEYRLLSLGLTKIQQPQTNHHLYAFTPVCKHASLLALRSNVLLI